jgi:hypothetical protein
MRPTRTIIAPIVAVLAAVTLAAPAAARPLDSASDRPYEQPNGAHAQDLRSPDAVDAAAGRGTFNAPAVTVVKVPESAPTPSGGVHWDDAAIGAAGATGVLMISLAGALALRHRQSSPRSRGAIG